MTHSNQVKDQFFYLHEQVKTLGLEKAIESSVGDGGLPNLLAIATIAKLPKELQYAATEDAYNHAVSTNLIPSRPVIPN
jgi:hypothetical protein